MKLGAIKEKTGLGNVVFELSNRASLSVKVVQLKTELRFLNITINIS
jgi:hypothetical protein